MFLYIFQSILIFIISIFLIYYYSHQSTKLYAKLIVLFSFYICLFSYMILPIDIYESSKLLQNKFNQAKSQNQIQKQGEQHNLYILKTWMIIFYINAVLSWIILPFFQDYEDSGQFTVKRKIYQALKFNIMLIFIILFAGFVVVLYLIIFQQFTITQLPSVLTLVVNSFGMLLVTVSLGFGLISLPKQFYIKLNHKKYVNLCHKQAQILSHQEQTIYEQIYHIRQLLKAQQQLFNSPQDISYLISLIQTNFIKIHQFRSYDDPPSSFHKLKLSQIHKIIKKQIIHYNSCQSQLDQTVDQLKQITLSYTKNNYKYKKIFYTLLFIFSSLISVIIYLSQISLFTTNKLSLIYWLNYNGSNNQIAYFINCLLLIYIVYVITHTIFRIKIYRVFQLRKAHTTAASLFFTSINMCRIAYPLCYNYLLLTSVQKTQFQQFIGQIQIPDQIRYIFPIIMILFGLFNLLDIYSTILGYLGLGSYAFDQEQAQQKKEQGKRILVERFRERNKENFQMEMIQLL